MPVWVWRALKAARRVPWTKVWAAVLWLATVGREYWDRLTPQGAQGTPEPDDQVQGEPIQSHEQGPGPPNRAVQQDSSGRRVSPEDGAQPLRVRQLEPAQFCSWWRRAASCGLDGRVGGVVVATAKLERVVLQVVELLLAGAVLGVHVALGPDRLEAPAPRSAAGVPARYRVAARPGSASGRPWPGRGSRSPGRRSSAPGRR